MATTITAPPRNGAGRIRIQGLPVRKWVRTTPGSLRVASVLLVIVLLVAGAVAVTAAHARADAAHAVAHGATPELVAAENLYGSLADVDATATTTYLEGGQEAPALRLRYDADIAAAGTHLAAVANDVGTSAASKAAVRTIAGGISQYAGLVESARANNRHGFSVGTAYLDQSSALMRDQLLPAATVVYQHAAARLDTAYRTGTSSTDLLAVLIAGAVALALLLGVQIFLMRRTRRWVNVGLAGASLLLVVIVGWTTVQLWSEQSALVDAQRHGSDALQVLSAARIDALRGRSDDNLALIARGTGASFVTDFKTMRGGLVTLLSDARTVAARTGTTARIDTLRDQVDTLVQDHAAVRHDDDNGLYASAVARATNQESATSAKLDASFRHEITSSASARRPGRQRPGRIHGPDHRHRAVECARCGARGLRTSASDRRVPMTVDRVRHRRAAAVRAGIAGLVLVIVGGCASSSNWASRQSTDNLPKSVTTTVPSPTTTTTPCTDQTSPRVSFPPLGPLPAPGQMPSGSTMADIQRRGYLNVGVDQNTPGFADRSADGSTITGFEIDLLRQVAYQIFGDDNPGRLRPVALTTAQRIPAVQSGQVDIAASLISYTCERQKDVSFSDDYFVAHQGLMVPRNSKITATSDLKGVRVCAYSRFDLTSADRGSRREAVSGCESC